MVPGFDDGVIRAAAAEADALILLLRVKLRTHPLPTRVSAFTPPQLLEGTDVGAPASPTREWGGWERDGGRRRERGMRGRERDCDRQTPVHAQLDQKRWLWKQVLKLS